MTETIDNKIENALKNKDIVKIMNKASSRFSKQLDPDTIYTCQLNALWKAFLHFKPEKQTKFTTYLYNGVFIECLKETKFKNKSQRCGNKLHDNISSNRDSFFLVDLLDELKTDEDRDLILDKMSNMTIQEIADKRNVSRETVRKKIKKIAKTFKNKFV